MTEPVPARPSATVILLRDSPAGPEMFMVRRHERSGFANSAYVFPGGSVVPLDHATESQELSSTLAPGDAATILQQRGDVAPSDPVECLGYWLAAARELLEEGGVLIHDDRRRLPLSDIGAIRSEALSDGDRFTQLLRDRDIKLDLARLIYFSHWRTPVQSPKRYDTRFFVAPMPAGQEASHCGIETTEALWITPTAALEANSAGKLRLVHATRAHIQRLAGHTHVASLLEFAAAKQIRCVDPIIQPDKSVYISPEVADCW